MIFVNDDSVDDSEKILLSLKTKYPIIIINMSRVFGTAPCVLAGFKEAKGDIIVYMDSDLQDPPEIVSEMYSKFKNGAEIVHASRLRRDGENFLKIWITKQAYKIINYFSDIDIPENTGDFKMLSKRVVQNILKLEEYDPFMRGLSLGLALNKILSTIIETKDLLGKQDFHYLVKILDENLLED